jgi:hypothetical protein
MPRSFNVAANASGGVTPALSRLREAKARRLVRRAARRQRACCNARTSANSEFAVRLNGTFPRDGDTAPPTHDNIRPDRKHSTWCNLPKYMRARRFAQGGGEGTIGRDTMFITRQSKKSSKRLARLARRLCILVLAPHSPWLAPAREGPIMRHPPPTAGRRSRGGCPASWR